MSPSSTIYEPELPVPPASSVSTSKAVEGELASRKERKRKGVRKEREQGGKGQGASKGKGKGVRSKEGKTLQAKGKGRE